MKFRGNRRQFKDLVHLAIAQRITARWDVRRNAWRRLQQLHHIYRSASPREVCEALRCALHIEAPLLLVERYPLPDGRGVAAFALCYRDPTAPRKPVLQ